MNLHVRPTLHSLVTLLSLGTFACQSTVKHNPSSPTNNGLDNSELGAWWAQFADASGSTNQPNDPSFQNLLANNLYMGCGYDPIANPNLNLVGDGYNSTGALLKGPNWEVLASSTLNLAGGLVGLQALTQFTINSGRPAAATSRAQSYATLYSNTASFAGNTQNDVQAALGRGANNPACGVLATHQNKMVSTDGKTWVNVVFDKAVPYFISPTLTPARFGYEIKQGLTVANVTATIESNDPDIVNENRLGSVTIAPLPAAKIVVDSFGNAITLNADYAYRVLSQFGPGSGNTPIAWLDQVTDYYVRGGHVTNIIVQIPRPDLSIVVYNIVQP